MSHAKTIKDTMYRNQLRTEWGELKDAAETEIKAIVECMCKKMFENMLGRLMLTKQYVAVSSTTSCNYCF